MSQTLAEKLRAQITGRSIVAYLILFALVLVFVLFDFKQGASGIGSVARVNNAQISVLDFQQEEQRIQQYYANLFGGAMDFSSQRQLLQQQAVENLVRQELVAQAAKHEGIIATDAEVRDFIVKDITVFQENGVFQRERYSRFLEMNHWSPAEFENKIRKEIALTRSRRFFESVAKPNQPELDKLKELKSHKMNIAFVKINSNELANKLKVSKEEVQKSLQDSEFMKKVESEFKATKSEYDQKDEVKAQHILLSVKDPSQADSVLQKIKAIKERLKKEDFGKVASQVSEDPGSKSKNGDLGYFSRGRMVKEFDDVAFGLAVGQISEPIKTQFGYHLIKVNDKKAAKEATLENSKYQVAEKLLAKTRIEDSLKKIEEALKKKDDSTVQAQVKSLNLNWEETGLFDLSAEVVPKLNGTNITAAAFEVSKESPWVDRLVRESSDLYLLKLKDSKVEPVTLEAQATDVITRKSSAQSYEAWVNNFKKTSKISINNKILQN